MPTLAIALGIESFTGNCILGYNIVLFLSISLVVGMIILYILRIEKILLNDAKIVKRNFRLLDLLIYMFTNTAVMILILGANLACNGSSMSVMVCIFSGPIASFLLIVFGFLVDLRIKYITAD